MTEQDFRFRTAVGDLPGTSIADWPIAYADLAPFYDAVEWAFGVSGQAGANAFEAPRSRDYPCPPMPMSRYAERFHAGCAALGWNSFPMPQAALSQPYDGRPATVLSAFAQQHGDPTGTRSSALNVFIPAAVATGRYELRPDCCVREISVDERGRATGAVYTDPSGRTVRQEADVVILACGAVETARLLLLSTSARFPDGLANRSDLVGRNVTFHEFSSSVGIFDDPIHGWAGGGYVAASTFEHHDHDDARGFAGGGHIASTGVGVPLPVNWTVPGKPQWGAEAKRADREQFDHSMAVSMVLHDMPRHENRVDLDDRVTDAWGLPVARITLEAHPNDLEQARYLIDRAADVLEAAGARTIHRVYIDRITGNCSHQHGTTRMGDDPETSVLDRFCRAHDVDNLFVVDGGPFPTGSGANPTLTIMANAWRVADHIVRAGRDGA
jgi:choline dehydrogenase-like flavoprotein